ncbi:hybrid sensor histidine kinase/response regulator [bacterium]|nr:hybrid sensor histidine kinase/response regulator [bacterium]NUN45008.1 hybrid sensor histidine kinase/response regulator [bacterium]HMV25248.1 hybrid sensor histidine kinase/response regulator [bacterium]HMW31760.1 hybrid sensor histidine kinase/response regulator [bacterium]HMZ02906.1 hybrid sensor histidine kinase/response regulator [bacterium]
MSTHAKILVVEDDFQNRQLIQIYLSRMNFDVTLAPNGFAAMEKLKTYKPDLIISDISMPYMDGFELYNNVKAIPDLRSIPFIFLTAHSDADKRRYGKEIGSDDFLTKPIEQEDLVASIRGKLKRVEEIRSSTEAEMLTQIDQLKREILSTITHEVNTPLFIIKLTANLLLDETMEFKPHELQELLLRIKKSGERLDALLKDFLITVRIAAGDAKSEYKEAKQDSDINFIVEHLVPQFKKRAEIKQLRIQSQLERHLPGLQLHVDQVADVVERLFSNAYKFTPPGGEIRIRSGKDHDYVRLDIEDTGIGIPEEQLDRIFHKFYQVNRAEMEQQGAGLGLAIARDLTEINGGRLVVKSHEGMGSTFSLLFPIHVI